MKNLLIAITSFIIILFFNTVAYPDQIIHVVKKGDNLYTISKKYKVPITEIKTFNNLNTERLSLGMKLTIPASSPNKNQGNNRTSQISNVQQKVISNPNPFDVKYHKVKKGETIEKIAKKYSTTQDSIIEINGLSSKKLKVGQQILIKAPQKEHHIVKKGDTLWNVALRYGISPDEIREINGLSSNQLKIGQKIKIAKNNFTDESSHQLQVSSTLLKQESPANKIEEVKILSKSEELLDLTMRERLIIFAKKMLHLPYKFGGNSPFGIDCSAFVQKVYSLIGINLPRSAREQFHLGEKIDKEELSVGDLVFFRTYASFPSHVGIYLGNNLFIHASSKTKKITIDSLDSPYYLKRFIGAKKVISEEDILNAQVPIGTN
ncbi:MAG: LysM peptidoglycan-binding domain-containing protein [Thermodesulfovibrionales bacterium]|nr:LysM peptidoglycan-binding domain-containing protein [Thermodesulfovibrionales bacterium]